MSSYIGSLSPCETPLLSKNSSWCFPPHFSHSSLWLVVITVCFTAWPRVSWSSLCSTGWLQACPNSVSAGARGMNHHAWLHPSILLFESVSHVYMKKENALTSTTHQNLEIKDVHGCKCPHEKGQQEITKWGTSCHTVAAFSCPSTSCCPSHTCVGGPAQNTLSTFAGQTSRLCLLQWPPQGLYPLL